MRPALDPALAVTLRRLREERGESREVVAVRAGLTVASLAHIELAQANPAWSTVKALAHALDVSMVQLAEAVEAASDT
jgi:transcriptional regulator with XRE-family HTH domain